MLETKKITCNHNDCKLKPTFKFKKGFYCRVHYKKEFKNTFEKDPFDIVIAKSFYKQNTYVIFRDRKELEVIYENNTFVNGTYFLKKEEQEFFKNNKHLEL